MLFSVHVADSGVRSAITRRAPSPDDVPGLRSAITMSCGPFSPGALPSLQLSREAVLACWDDADSVQAFLADHSTGRELSSGLNVTMELFRAVGMWPGTDVDMEAAAAEMAVPDSGPTVAITIGRAYLTKLRRFLRVTAALEEQFLDAPNTIWGTGMANVAKLMVGTLTVWDSAAAAESYMRNGAHAAAVRDHFDYAKDPTGHTFVTGGGFFGFRPVSVSGALPGRNPFPAGVELVA